jgi:Na+/proline symporter
MTKKDIVTILVQIGLVLILVGIGLNTYVTLYGLGEVGSVDATLSFENLVLKTNHPGFAVIVVGSVLLVVALWATLTRRNT